MATPGAKDGSDFILMAASRALVLPAQGRVDEAWEYISSLLSLMPGSVTNIVASIICLSRGVGATDDAFHIIHLQQMKYFEEGRRLFKDLPPERRSHPELVMLLTTCFEAAVCSAMRFGDNDRLCNALTLCSGKRRPVT